MPHLIKTTQLAEFLIYSNYIPFQLIEGIFPVPPIGEEFIDEYVPPMKSKIKYENKYNELVEKEEYGWTQPGWKEELTTKNCKNLAKNPSPDQDFIEQILDQIKKYETLDEILHAIRKLSLATDACFHCVWLKHKVPGKIINCTGIPKLCSLKYYSPVWNRNGEGKLQALEKEEEEDDDDKKKKSNWIQVD